MRNDDVRMVLGAMQDFRENRINNKRWAEKQLLDAEMRKRDEQRYDDQKKLAEAMAERDERRLNHQLSYADKQFNYQASRDAVNDRRADDHYIRTGNWRAEDMADRRSAAAHGQKMDLSRAELNRMEYELKKQQFENQPNSTATYGWGSDEDGNPTFGPQSYTTSFRSNGDSIGGPQGVAPNQSTPASPPSAAQTAAAVDYAASAAPEPTSYAPPSTGASGPLAEPIDSGLMPNPAVTGIPTLPNMHNPTEAPAPTAPEAQGPGIWREVGSGLKKAGKAFWDKQPLVMGVDNYAKAAKEAPAKHKTQREQRKAANNERAKNWAPQIRAAVNSGQMTPAQADAAAEERALRKAAEQFDAQAQY